MAGLTRITLCAKNSSGNKTVRSRVGIQMLGKCDLPGGANMSYDDGRSVWGHPVLSCTDP